MKNEDLLIVLIHNHETVMPSRVVAQKLASEFDSINLLEVFEQSYFSEKVIASRLIYDFVMQLRIEDSWRIYRGKRSHFSTIKAKVNLTRKILLLFAGSNYRKTEWRIREIERAVSLKHQKAWQKFQQSNANWLLILESDAAWIDSDSEGIPELLELLQDSSPTYVNLAGGLNLNDLGVDLLMQDIENSQRRNIKTFSKPITNTSCAYAVNRTLVNFFLSHTEKFPDQKSLGIDWLINGMFMDMERQDLNVTCVHSYPPILFHGSMTGISSSWHPGRG